MKTLAVKTLIVLLAMACWPDETAGSKIKRGQAVVCSEGASERLAERHGVVEMLFSDHHGPASPTGSFCRYIEDYLEISQSRSLTSRALPSWAANLALTKAAQLRGHITFGGIGPAAGGGAFTDAPGSLPHKDRISSGVPASVAYPLDLLSAIVEDAGWSDALALDDSNPFARLLASTYRPATQSDNGTSSSGDSSGSTSSGQTDSASSDNGGADDSTTDKPTDPPPQVAGKPEKLIITNTYTAKAKQLDDTHLELSDRVVTLSSVVATPGVVSDSLVLIDDYNQDRYTDALFVSRGSGQVFVFSNLGSDWFLSKFFLVRSPLNAATLMVLQPAGGKPKGKGGTSKELLVYSENREKLHIYSSLTKESPSLERSIPMPIGFDAMVGIDQNSDGFDDLVMLSLLRNAAILLLNQGGSAFQPSTAFIPVYQLQAYEIQPAGDGKTRSVAVLRIGSQTYVYTLAPDSGVVQILASFTSLRRNECLVFGDFDQNGVLDAAVAIAQ